MMGTAAATAASRTAGECGSGMAHCEGQLHMLRERTMSPAHHTNTLMLAGQSMRSSEQAKRRSGNTSGQSRSGTDTGL